MATMIILTLLFLLLAITSATPISADQNPSSPLHSKRAGTGGCLRVYGDGVLLPDCFDALNQMRHHLDSLGGTDPYFGPFSTGNSNPLFSLPKVWRSPTCTIGLDIKHPELSISAKWSSRVRVAEMIVERCVVPMSIGGEWHSEEYFLTTVVNERRMDPRLRSTWNSCLRTAGQLGDTCASLTDLAMGLTRSGLSQPTTQ